MKLRIAILMFLISCQPKERHKAESGRIDLMENTLDHIQLLNGDWEFYWQKFINPQDFEEGIHHPQYVEVPNTWTVYKDQNGDMYPDYGYATYRLKVTFDQMPTKNLGLLVPKIWSASKVWINGNMMSKRGEVSQIGYKNLMVEEMIQLPPERELEIVIQVSNYSLFVGGIIEPFKIAHYQALSNASKLKNTFELAWIGCVAMMGLFLFILYFFIRKNKSLVYFAIACILIVVKLTVFGSHDLYVFLKTFNELLSFKWQSTLYYASTYMLVAVGLLYIRSLYPDDAHTRVTKAFFIITSLYSLFLIFSPVNIFLPTILPFQIIMFFGVTYLFCVIAKATIRKRKESKLQAFGVIVMIFAGLNDALHTFGMGIIGNAESIPLGFGLFISLQFIVIAKRFAGVYQGLERLSQNLEEEVNERTMEVIKKKEEIEEALEKIKQQKEEIESQNNKLEEAQNIISIQNDQLIKDNQHLESLVEQRTTQLQKSVLQLSETNKNLDHFIYRSSHDLKGPIARLLGLCELVKVDTETSNVITYFNLFEQSTKEMDDLISCIKRAHEINRKELELHEVELTQVIEKISQRLSHKFPNAPKITLELPSGCRIFSDTELLNVLFENVLDNAIKFSNPSQTNQFIKVIVEERSERMMSVSIRDNGISIAPEFVDRAFDMFTKGTDKSKGFGLGLYEAKIIANKIKAKISLNRNNELTQVNILLLKNISVEKKAEKQENIKTI
ncbi:7TM diverse intracellular signaling domain-containing protein [Fulvivirgaceae bacterium BMA10]|uniref:histidine kinase n=1 Tax=Splendidivirga corallicola TaxID=3051826 RepID=A0ABT8KL87_9BACT|nr:7TM diverse intracellular signaling domain-containing protein [Fulvivirgaceae bacterium BMA10]